MGRETSRSEIRDAILLGDEYKLQEARLKCYFYGLTKPQELGPFTGAHFDAFESQDRILNAFTVADFYAVSALSITVPSKAGFKILDPNNSIAFSERLAKIDYEQKIEEIANEEEFDRLLGPKSCAQKLWDLLRRNKTSEPRWGIGATTASKMMHRKRPHLIPIHDSVLRKVITDASKDHWRQWWEALAGKDGAELCQRARQLRKAIDKEELSILRVLDVVLWMDPRYNDRAEKWDNVIHKHIA